VSTARWQALAAAVLFSTGGAAIKTAAFTGFQVSAVRSGVAALTLLLVLKYPSRPGGGRIRWTLPVFSAAAVYAATLTLFVVSTKLTTAADAIFLQSTAPLYILLLAPLVLGERFRMRDVPFIAALAAGMALCFAGRSTASVTAPDPATGNVLGALCGVAWALTLIALRYTARDPTGGTNERHGSAARDAGMSAVVLGNVLACMVAMPAAWPFPSASAGEWATLTYLGVFQIGLAYLCLTAAVRRLHALEVSLLLLLEPVLNPVWTWAVRGEAPGVWTIVGGTIIVLATAGKAVADSRPPAVPVSAG
jgi:drug/metabolite transporter (DMT)-like permease